jgi:hypothetical protein
MIAVLRLPFALALLMAAIAVPCLGQTTAQVAAGWGLTGAWRVDCSKPPGDNNVELRYIVKNGQLYYDREFGKDRDSSMVESAEILPDNSIEVVINITSISQRRRVVYIKEGFSRIRATLNVNLANNEFTVIDGRFTSNNNPTPWILRCRNPSA